MTTDNKHRKYGIGYRKRNRIFNLQQKLLRSKCEECGLIVKPSNSHLFHWAHKEGYEKFANISWLVRDKASIARIAFEISKCRLICVSCHFIETQTQKHYLNQHNLKRTVVDQDFDQLELDL